MDKQFASFDSDNYQCLGCANDVLSDVESDDEELPHQLLDHFLDKSRSAKKEISCRPCYHGRLETPIVAFNVAALQLSYDLLDKVEHIPRVIAFTEKCTPQDFYELFGCSRDSKEILTNIIVFKFTPEDIEDESPTETLYQHLVQHKSFAFTKLKCDKFSKLYALPLPKENEPPAFLPIKSRLNLETCPRDDNILLGVLVKKSLEEGLVGVSHLSPVKVDSPKLPKTLSPDHTDAPPSSNKPVLSSSPNCTLPPATLEKIKSGLESRFKLMPLDRYCSYIGAPTEDIPFLTDPVTTSNSVTPKKSQSATSALTDLNLLDNISSESEEDLESSSTKPPANLKRALSTASQSDRKPDKQNIQMKQQCASSSPNLSSSPSSTQTSHQIQKLSKSKVVPGSSNSPKKVKMSDKKIIDIELSSESDPDSDLFPRQPNKLLTGIFISTVGDFEFKYHVLRSDRPEVNKYLPNTLTVKGRARALDCEQFLTIAKHKPNVKMILFQILPRETLEDKRIFGNFATYLVNRDRYGLIDYKPQTYRAYILPVVKGTQDMKAFEILNLKPRKKYFHELYGLVIKKSAMTAAIPTSLSIRNQQSLPSTSSGQSIQATSSTSSNTKDKSAIESSEVNNLTAIYGAQNFPDLDVTRLANLIHSSVDDLITLSCNISNLLQKTTEKIPEAKKIEAMVEFQSKVIFIMTQEEQQHAKRKKAYETVLSWLKTLRP